MLNLIFKSISRFNEQHQNIPVSMHLQPPATSIFFKPTKKSMRVFGFTPAGHEKSTYREPPTTSTFGRLTAPAVTRH